jgi:AraC-like DNA-binding protein
VPGLRIATRRQGLNDGCWSRDRWLLSDEERRALRQPETRPLVVAGAGHFHDYGHGHVFAVPSGMPFSTIFICTEGTGWVSIEGVKRRLPTGSAMLIPSGVPHAYGAAQLPWSVWWCALAGSDSHALIRTVGVSLSDPTVRLRDAPRLAAIIEEIAAVYEEEHSPEPLDEAAGIARSLMTGMGADLTLADPDPVRGIQRYLAEHFAEWVSVAELASRVGLSRTRLNQRFQAATGGGVRAYQIELRMACARRLLAETDDDVATIARRCGYSDPDYFSRQFGRTQGVSPTRYRARSLPPVPRRTPHDH